MKINGLAGKLATERVVIPRHDGDDIVLTMQAWPVGMLQTVAEMVPDPEAKYIGIESDPSTGATLKNPDGSPVKKYDTENPKFRRRVEDANKHQNAILIVMALRGDPNVQIEAKYVKGKGVEYAKAILAEFDAFGVSIGDWAIMRDAAYRVSNLSKENVDKAQADFFSREKGLASASQKAEPSTTGPS